MLSRDVGECIASHICGIFGFLSLFDATNLFGGYHRGESVIYAMLLQNYSGFRLGTHFEALDFVDTVLVECKGLSLE